MNTLLSEKKYDIAVIGAGIAGSYCADRLQAAGLQVCIVDKSRGTGGRASSKRLANGNTLAHADASAHDNAGTASSCELGAPFFHLEGQQLLASVDRWLAAGVIAPWPAADQQNQSAFTGTPTMSALTRHLIQHCDFFGSEKISIIERDGNAWRLLNDSYQCRIQAKRLIITAPAAQSAILLSGSAAPEAWLLDAHRASLSCAPQWATVVSHSSNLVLSQAQIDTLQALPAVIEFKAGPIARIILDSQKPQRTSSQFQWVLQADQGWSQQVIDADNQWVSEQLMEVFTDWLNDQQDYRFESADFSCLPAHRWRLGRHHSSTASASLFDYRWSEALGLAIAADWLGAGSVYAAMQSADNLVKAILAGE